MTENLKFGGSWCVLVQHAASTTCNRVVTDGFIDFGRFCSSVSCLGECLRCAYVLCLTFAMVQMTVQAEDAEINHKQRSAERGSWA